ncbi:MAG: SET domain-containing protein [Bacteroidetes bacterium]|jgi:SET domain-containing protein|nr:SET domain-containing protein [Bacteroidota bacterium]MDA0936199.1 SET domain-containing protein [Bacteroidota bacterium]
MIKKTNWRPLPEFLTIKESKIEGLGVFATRDLPKGFDLGISHIFDKRFPDGYIRLPLGGFINHHEIPNCKAIVSEEDQQMGKLSHIRIQALAPIAKGEEITISYIINRLDDPNWEFEYEISQ